ncbi:MAG: oligoendopeptidase F [Chloroflexota bacterium]
MTQTNSQNTEIIPPRSAIAPEHTWNAESVFSDAEAWEVELKAIQADLPALAKFQGEVKAGPDRLAGALEKRDELIRRMYVVYMYASMQHEVDKGDQAAAMMNAKAGGAFGQVLAAAAFIEPETIEIGQAVVQEWMQIEPRLAIYAHYFADLFRQQAHVRSAEVEELLGMLADPFSSVGQTAGMLTDADLKFAPAVTSEGHERQVTQGNLLKILAEPDRPARRTAWEHYMDAHLAVKNTLANNLATSIKQNVFMSRARRHPATLEAALFALNVDPAVFHNLIETFRKNLPTWQRYFALRRKALGVEQLEPYDLWAPLTPQRQAVPYRQAVDWICEGLVPLGADYVEILRKGCLEQRWVDIYPNQGKFSGAFSSGAPGTYPFIAMSYTDEIFSLSTLAHELGHSMHSYLTWQNQPFVYSNYSLFVAEVASNFHQAMVRAYLLEKEKDVHFQIGLIEEAMANFLRYFFIMPTLARFELETHQRVERGEGLSAEAMTDLMADLFQEAYGGEVHLDRERVGITWATFSHLYVDYYVYQYATGISGANALARRVLSGAPGAAQDYLCFLKAGASLYPLDALKLGGVDLSTPQPVEETFAVMAGMVDRLETLLA